MLDGEPRRERPARAGPAAAAAGHPPRPGAGPAPRVAVGPAVAHALDAAGAAARGAAWPRVPPRRRREPVPQGPVGHRHAGQHAQPRRRDHHRGHHPARIVYTPGCRSGCQVASYSFQVLGFLDIW